MARTAEEAMNAYAVHACIGTGVRLYALRFPIFRRSSPPITTQKCRADDGRRDPRGGARLPRTLTRADPRPPPTHVLDVRSRVRLHATFR